MTTRTTKKASPKLPTYLYARVERARDGEDYLVAYHTDVEAMADGGPVGTYQLVNKRARVKRPMAPRAKDVTTR